MSDSSTAIDLEVFGDLQANTGADFVVELVDTFLDEAPQLLAQLRSAHAAGEADNFRRAAHSLKSNGNTFGALGFAAQARSLELAPLPEVGLASIERLEQLFQQAAARLQELCHG
ncbi:Hpt domain-containing protein [Pelomonas sp. V22]|uniref:Hpt domain-containing protein n=1 Tax=Pelomonas sp. V22 TaxID=2822139 RepID=UPI0024A90B4C|nr:Hpt domain-containing protein [Pelomonas sp. V22]MDI4635113.1 Hpt domain-containing protein [Pelomonas sp. V22]